MNATSSHCPLPFLLCVCVEVRVSYADLYRPHGCPLLCPSCACGGVTGCYMSCAGTWTEVTTTGGPPTARTGHSVVAVEDGAVMIVYGGHGDGDYFRLNDVWRLTLATGDAPFTVTWLCQLRLHQSHLLYGLPSAG